MLNVASVTSTDINNGIGFRTTIWISGCQHKCPGCHNEELWRYDVGKPLNSPEIIDCIINETKHSYIDGITLSGGDPLYHDDHALEDLILFLKTFKSILPNKTIWLYTGFLYEYVIHRDLIRQIFSLVDVIVDGPYIKELRDITLPFRGSSNQRIIDAKKTLEVNLPPITIPDEVFTKP